MSIVSQDRAMSVTFFCFYPVFIVLTDCSNIFNSKSWMHAWIYANAQERVVSHFYWYYIRIKDRNVAFIFFKKGFQKMWSSESSSFFVRAITILTTHWSSLHTTTKQCGWCNMDYLDPVDHLDQLDHPDHPGPTWPAGPLGPIELLWSELWSNIYQEDYYRIRIVYLV